MKNLLIFCAAFLISQALIAQNITVSDRIDTVKGKAIEPNTVWNMTQTGGTLYLMLNAGDTYIPSKILTINIDKLNDKTYRSYDIKKGKTNADRSWASVAYYFKEAGQYRIAFLDSSYKEIAYSEILIKMIEGKAPDNIAVNGADQFSSSVVEFGNNIDTKGNLSGKNNTFVISRDGGVIKVKVTNPFPFNTTKFFVDTYKRNRRGNYELYESKNYPIYAEKSTWIYFSYLFTEPGAFKLAIYTKENTFVNNGVVNIIQP